MPKATARPVHYVLSTHWDREWYQPLQDYRYRLVQLLDHVLAGFADGTLQGPFQMDGQLIPVEDYLEVRPQRTTEVKKLIADGRLRLGPWYVMPDEFLVSGESLIRNLRLGRECTRALGGVPSDAGFICDIFGHNSQMPQIFAGFGIRFGFLWRGINVVDKRLFRWQAADGTEMPSLRFGNNGYCTFCFEVRRAREADAPQTVERLTADLDKHLAAEAAITEAGPVMLFDGGDHQGWDADSYRILRDYMKKHAAPYALSHVDLDAYIAAVLPEVKKISTLLKGELREPARHANPADNQWLIPGVLASRVWIKQDNAACQTALCHWAEPFAAFAARACGGDDHVDFLKNAWRWLIQNHPHDSICGCSIDQVHEDMKYRFSQCRQIANRVTIESQRRLSANVAGTPTADELRLTVFNPLPCELREPVTVTVDIPAGWPTAGEFFGFEAKPNFRLFDGAGREVAFQRLAQAMDRSAVRTHAAKFPEGYRMNQVTIAFEAAIPALGYASYTVRKDSCSHPVRHAAEPGLATSENSLANDLIAVTVQGNGSLTVTDKRTGTIYDRWLTFEDCADIGDGWYHGPAVNDQLFTSTGAQCAVALAHNTPLLAAIRVRTTMAVPEEFDFRAMRRSEKLATLTLDSLITLRQGCDRLEIETTVSNPARDHRLRVLFPSGATPATTYLADSSFDVVERPIALRADNHLYRELEIAEKPQQTWTAVYAAKRGAVVFSNGLLESAVRDLPERPIALTLFRGTRRTVFTDGEPLGQLEGTLRFRYWVSPLTGAPDYAACFATALRAAADIRSVCQQAKDVALYRQPGVELPAAAAFLSVDGDAVLTSARQVGDAFEVRLFNPTGKPLKSTLRFGAAGHAAAFSRLTPVDFESQPVGPAQKLTRNCATVTLGAKKIVTFRAD